MLGEVQSSTFGAGDNPLTPGIEQSRQATYYLVEQRPRVAVDGLGVVQRVEMKRPGRIRSA